MSSHVEQTIAITWPPENKVLGDGAWVPAVVGDGRSSPLSRCRE
jgi:hypothetical protein